jgi:hypothetical protein
LDDAGRVRTSTNQLDLATSPAPAARADEIMEQCGKSPILALFGHGEMSELESVMRTIVLQKSKVASARIFGETLKGEAINDSYDPSGAAEVAYEFSVRR